MAEKTVTRVCQQCGGEFQFKAALIGWAPGKYCGPACRAKGQVRPIADRFWEKVRRGEGCWIWTGSTGHRGYGQIWDGGRLEQAQRVAYRLEHGEFDRALDVLHTCDNPSCVRPDHLFLGTAKDNSQDMKAKGRGRGGRKYWKKNLTHS